MSNKNKKDSVVLYGSYLNDIKDMQIKQIGLLFIAILSYATDRTMPKIDDAEVKGCFRLLKHQIDFDTERYLERCEQNRKNAYKRYGKTYSANGCDCIHNEKDNCNDNGNENENEKENEKEKESENIVSIHSGGGRHFK